MTVKICSYCKIEQPIENYWKCCTQKDGFQSRCKACKKKDIQQDTLKKRAAKAAKQAQRSIRIGRGVPVEEGRNFCSHCGQIKPADHFTIYFSKRLGADTLNTTCKACRSEISGASQRRQADSNPIEFWCKVAHRSVHRRGLLNEIAHTMTLDDLRELAKTPVCAYCGKTVVFAARRDKETVHSMASMDRVEGEKGYTKENVVLACYRCNTCKNSATLAELELIVSGLRRLLRKTS